MGALALSCLVFLPAQAPQDVFATNQRVFKIPVDIQPTRRPEIDRMVLYVSRDQGTQWQQHQIIPPDKDGFIFSAGGDGEYWFIAAAINKQGKQEPENLYKRRPDLKLLVDTLAPRISFRSARREGEFVIVSWEIQEEHPNLKSIYLKYQSEGALTWEPVLLPQALLVDETRIRIDNPAPVRIVLEVRDQAGNLSSKEITVPGALTTATFKEKAEVPAKAKDGTELVLPPQVQKKQELADPPPADAKPMWEKDQVVPPPADGKATWDSTGKAPPPLPTERPAAPPEPREHSAAVSEPRQPLPQVQFVNKAEVVVKYEISEARAGRVGKVELWLTRDDGHTWKPWMADDTVDRTTGAGEYVRTLPLPGEGLYGLALVVRNLAGRGREPRPGDVPEMRIEVDMTPPFVQLHAPRLNPSQRNTVILIWKATDRNLGAKPITLEWAANRDGPWREIATNLPNTGSHVWELPADLPVLVYLRVRVRDLAGNEAVAVSEQPQLLDVSEPQGRLRGIVRE